jgi:RNA polymerase sigma factor (TIGR02999 family)
MNALTFELGVGEPPCFLQAMADVINVRSWMRHMHIPRPKLGRMQEATKSSQESAPESVHELFPALYRELKRLARLRLSGGGRHTLLDTSALINEAFLRMQRDGGVAISDREHFLAYAATTMRSIVIDFVRRRTADRRGGLAEHVTLDTRAAAQLGAQDDEILAVHEALASLQQVDPQLVQLVELRYFGGLNDAEIGAVMGVTDRTVRRHWERARLLLVELLNR